MRAAFYLFMPCRKKKDGFDNSIGMTFPEDFMTQQMSERNANTTNY